MIKDDRLRQEIQRLKNALESRGTPEKPSDPVLRSLWEALLLARRRYEEKLRELRQAASERDAFYSDMQHIRAEHHLAEKIQRSLLPGDAEAFRESHRADLFADMDTAWEIGGDYYDYFPLNERLLFFCIGDVSGKGVPAALFTAVCKTAFAAKLRSIFKTWHPAAVAGAGAGAEAYEDEIGRRLESVFSETAEELFRSQHSRGKQFVTLWAGILDAETGEVTFVNAGHEPPILACGDQTFQLLEQRGGMPIGAFFSSKKPEMNRYISGKRKLGPGETLILYTDGLTDSENEEASRFGRQQILDTLGLFPVLSSSSRETVSFLERRIGAYADRGERDDDITILALKYLG